MSMSDDILIRLRLDEGNVAAGLGRLRSEAGKLESALGDMADIGAVSGQVKAIGGAIVAGVDQIEGKYNRLAQKLKDIRGQQNALSNPGSSGDSKEIAKYEAALKSLKEAEGRVMSSMASVGKNMNKALEDIAKLGMKSLNSSIGDKPGAGALNRVQVKNYEGGGMEAAIAALKAAYLDEEREIRATARSIAKARAKAERDQKRRDDADDSALKSRVDAQRKESARAERIRQGTTAGQMDAAKRQIAIDRAAEASARKNEASARKAEAAEAKSRSLKERYEQKLVDSNARAEQRAMDFRLKQEDDARKRADRATKQQLTPQVAAKQIVSEQLAINEAERRRKEDAERFVNEMLHMNQNLKGMKSNEVMLNKELLSKLRAYAAAEKDVNEISGRGTDIRSKAAAAKAASLAAATKVDDEATRAELARRLLDNEREALKKEKAAMAAELANPSRRGEWKGGAAGGKLNLPGQPAFNYGHTADESRSFAQNRIKEIEARQAAILEVGVKVARDAVDKRAAATAAAAAHTARVAELDKQQESQLKANNEYLRVAEIKLKVEGAALDAAKAELDKTSSGIKSWEQQIKLTADSQAKINAENQKTLVLAQSSQKAAAQRRQDLMNPANQDKARAIADQNLSGQMAASEALQRAAIARQMATLQAKINLYGVEAAQVATNLVNAKSPAVNEANLKEIEVAKLRLSRLRDVEAQLKLSLGTPQNFARTGGAPPPNPNMPPPGFNPIQPRIAPLMKTMASNIGDSMADMVAKLRAGAGHVEKFGNSFTEAGGKLVHFVDKAAFGMWKVQGAVRLVTGVWEQFMEVLSKGETILKVEYAFETMTKGAGASMEKFREATKNMVSDEGIQKLANFGVQQKMTGKELEMIMQRASGASLVTGRTTEEITRRFVEGISKQEREIMDEATVIMSNASVIWNKEAKRLGKKASDLTQQEKQKAYMADFVQQSAHLERVAANFPDKLGKIAKAQTTMTNAWNTLWGQVAKTFGESGALDQMGQFIGKVTEKLGSISGNDQAITWAKQFGDLMTEMARTSLGAATALSPLAAVIPLIANALHNMNGPLQTAVNLWARYQTMKLEGIGAVVGLAGMGFGAASGDQGAVDSGMSMFLDSGKGIANAAGFRSEEDRATDIKYTQKARDAMAKLEANPAEGKAEFQTAASNAKEYTKALSYLYSEEKRIVDLRAQNQTKPLLSDTGTNYQNALDATRQGVVGMSKSGNIVDVAGAAFDIASNRSKSRAMIDGAKVELKNMDEWLQYRKAAAEKAREARDAFDPLVEISQNEDGIRSTVKMSKYEQMKKDRENNLVPDFMEPLTFHGPTDANQAQYLALQNDFMEKERAFTEINMKAESLKGVISSSTSELGAAMDAQDKFLDSFKAFNEEDARMMSGDLYEKTMVTIPGRLQDRMSIKDWIGSRSTLKAGAVAEYGPENRIGEARISQDEVKELSDELTMDPARKKDAAGLDQYKQEAVKTNLEAFRRMEVQLLDEQFKLQNEKAAMAASFEAKSRDIAINYAMEMMNSYLMSGDPESLAKAEEIRLAMTEASMQSASTLMSALPQGHADGISLAISEAQATGEKLISVQGDRIQAELDNSRAMITELEKRLKTKGGGRKKEKKFINSEIMDLAESFGSEAAGSSAAQAFNMNRDSLGSTYGKGKFAMETERLAAGYMGRLSNETAEAFERGIKIEVDDEVKARIKRIVDENQQLQKDIMVEAMKSGSQEEFKKAQDRIGALQAALEKTDLLQHYEDSSGISKAISTRNEQLQREAELWERNSEFTKLAKDSAERANQADFDYRKGMAERMAASREYAMAMTGPSAQFGAYGMEMEEVDPEDIPDYMRTQAQDPLSAMKKEEWDRKRDAIKKERDQRLQELQDLHRGRGELGAVDMGGLWSQQQLINQEANSQLGMVQLEQDADGLAQTRALSQRYYEEVKKPWENMGMDLTGMFAESLAFGMNDMWVAALNDAEDWTESMMALFENMTGAIGGMLQETASATIAAYTGSPLLGKISGGLIKGTWDAIMNLFKKKDKKEDDQNKRAERELRRKETKKADSFTVVLVNNGLSVNRDTARQVGAAVNAYVNGGGKLKNSR